MDQQIPPSSLTEHPLLRSSNLNCFLDHTTPIVQYHNPLQRSSCQGGSYNARKDHCKSTPSFSLRDLWMSFDEWSAYGVGVPLVLPCGKTAVQYYVPYLSAIQIYLQAGYSFSPSKRRQGDDSDCSDASDGRETSSDAGSDYETKSDQWDSSSGLSFGKCSSDSASDEQGRDVFFEYFERGSPYNRAPLAGKISELAAAVPHLLTLSSNELLPASWFSVAWYPIYRIPMGSTMNDLPTCFLTFHALWMPPFWQGQSDEPNGELWSPYKHNDDVSLSDREQRTGKVQEQWLQGHSAWRLKPRSVLELPAFGLASYKRSGRFWEFAGPGDKQHLNNLAVAADEWLRQLRVHHPDFDFFASREKFSV